MLEMDEAIRLGRDTTGHQARIEHINAQIEKVKSSYVRHKPFKNAKNKAVIFAKGMVEKVPGLFEPGAKFVKKVAGKAAEKVVNVVTGIKPIGNVVRRQKAKKALMEVDPETRREIRQETQDAINKKAKQITQSVAQSEYINKITQALLKENRGDLAKKITNSESARAALEEALRQSRSKRSEADGIIKTTKDARARTEAIERKKEIDKEIRRLQAAQRIVVPESVEPVNVSEDEAGRARRQAHKTAQNKATAKYKGKRKSTSSTGSAYESKEERKSEGDKKEDKSATVDEKKVKELVEKELSKRIDSATENAIKKGVKVGDVNVSNAAIKKLALRVKKAEGETAKLKRQLKARRIPKGMEVPKIELNNTPPDTPTGNA